MKKGNIIDSEDWDKLVQETYGRPYSLHQQDGSRDRVTIRITVPDKDASDFTNTILPEEVNHHEKGVSFAAWLARNPKQKLSTPDQQEDYCLELWWSRNFYPDVSMVANDLYVKGLLAAGEYVIVIDW